MVPGALQHTGQDELNGLNPLSGLASQDDGDVAHHSNLPDYFYRWKKGVLNNCSRKGQNVKVCTPNVYS